MATRKSSSEDTAPAPESQAREAIRKHADAIVAVVLSLVLFGAAYFVRVLPMLRSVETQMQGIHAQLAAVNESLVQVGENELFRLQLTAHGLQDRLDALGRGAEAVDAELDGGASDVEAVRRRLTELRTGADALGQALESASQKLGPQGGEIPDVRRAAEALVAQLREARALLVPEGQGFPKLYEEAAAVSRAVQEAQERVGRSFPDLRGKAAALSEEMERSHSALAAANERLAAVRTEAKELAEKVALARKAAAVVPCDAITGAKTLDALRRKGFCPR